MDTIIALLKTGKEVSFNYTILTTKQNKILAKYVNVIAKGTYWKKNSGNFTNKEIQVFHTIKRKIAKSGDKELEVKELKEIKEIFNYLKIE